MRQKRWLKGVFLFIATLLASLIFFRIIFIFDNKYTARANISQEGWTVLSESDLAEAVYLTDGWDLWTDTLLEPNRIWTQEEDTAQKVFVGEYLNFASFHNDYSPYGTATWRLQIKYNGPVTDVSLYLPEIFSACRIYVNGSLLAACGSLEPYQPKVQDTLISVPLLAETEILIQTSNYSHYYGGLTYPPILGTTQVIAEYLCGRMLFYGFLCFATLTTALFSAAHWLGTKHKRDRVALLFGVLSLGFSIWISYPFTRFFGMTQIRPIYALEDAAFMLVLWCALRITIRLCKVSVAEWPRRISRFALSMIFVSILVPLFVLPAFPAYAALYGKLITGYRFFAAITLAILTFYGNLLGRKGADWIFCGTLFYGAGLLAGALTVSSFEPARFGWMEEYGALALVTCFGVLMVSRSYAMLQENQRLNKNLQKQVEEKTLELKVMVKERENLISKFLHDMKSPAAFMLSYSQMVRKNNICLDEKTQEQLAVIEEKCSSFTERVRQVQQFTSENPLIVQREELDLKAFLEEFYRFNQPDVEMEGQNFRLYMKKGSCIILGNKDKLTSLMQNLIYNAVHFTPSGGEIRIHLTWDDEIVRLSVEDTGCGIEPEIMPKIFDQFYTTHAYDGGTGMGLYIVRTIAKEHGGDVKALSTPGKGTTFLVSLPFANNAL